MNRLLDYSDQVLNHHKSGQARGKEIGFHCLKDLITFKPKYTTYILGFPRAGKTEIHLEILFNLTEMHGDRHALMSPEIGGVEDVIAELVSKHLKKNFFKSANSYAATEKEIIAAMNYLSEYFYVMDNDDKDYDIDMFFDDCVKIEKDNKIKLNTTSIDPWNDLEENLDKFGGREDKYLAAALRKVRSKAKKHDWHNFIVTHAKDMPPIELKGVNKEKVICTAIPTLQSFAGGQVWSRRGFNVIGMWKPEKGAINRTTNLPFEDNQAMFKVLKSKPKGSGMLGFTYLYYDWKTNRYYEMYENEICYSGDYKKVAKRLADEEEERRKINAGEALEMPF